VENKYETKKEQIIKDAKKAFLSFGFKKTTMDDIAKKMDLKKNTLYYYFKSKNDLFDEVVKESLAELIAAVEHSMGKAKSAEAKIKAGLHTFAEEISANVNDYQITVKILLEFICVMEKNKNRQISKLPIIISEALKKGMKTKEFKKHNAEELAVILLDTAASFEIVKLSKISYGFLERNSGKNACCGDYYFEKGIDLILNGIKK
jgi:AcrR family transcriptional regulator